MPNTAAPDEIATGPPAVEAGRDREEGEGRADDAEPGDGLRLDLVEHRHGDRRADVLRDRREDEQRLRREAVLSQPAAPPTGGAAVVSGDEVSRTESGSVRQISSQSGWNENQPAKWLAGRARTVCCRVLVADLDRVAGGHRHQLGLARALHRDEPEARLVDGLADGEQPVVLVDRRLAGREQARRSPCRPRCR